MIIVVVAVFFFVIVVLFVCVKVNQVKRIISHCEVASPVVQVQSRTGRLIHRSERLVLRREQQTFECDFNGEGTSK